MTVAAATAVEGSPLVFTITQSVTSGIPTSVQWTLSAGTATPGADYSVASGTAVIGAGQTATTVFVTTLFDTVDESDETLTFTLSQPQNADLGAPVSAVGMIEDTALYLDFMTGTLPPEVSFTRASTG
ncbi:MAG TPA: Calx-beta domain-containing protein, partial [Bdellovibrionales bacterium]|nr:Calx-beta domain-containing protein [Bdellovibrionales bacterium]